MAAGRQKQFVRPPPKKKPQKAAALETVDEFQEAADFEESAGGKHRAGDPVKSARAFVRALDVYDKGLQKHPSSFDLAYNKARLQLEISAQPVILEHIGLELTEWLQLTLQSHRYALRLREDDKDILFNTAQVLISLAEQLSEHDRPAEAVALLQEALELLSSCLSRQEMLFEQHQLDFPDNEDGGVSLEPDEEPGAPSEDVDMPDEQSAIVEVPVTASDLLDTVHASLSALTTLAPLADQKILQSLGDMAHSLTESKAPDYIRMVPPEEQDKARTTVALDRAIFIAAYANAQFDAHLIEFQTYLERLDAFDMPSKDEDVRALSSEAEARTECVLSAIDRYEDVTTLPAMVCWKQLSIAQDLYTKATKLSSEDAQESKAELYKSKGDVELLRHNIATLPKADITDSVRKSAQTLIQNAQTYYKGASSHAKATGDDELEADAQTRMSVSKQIAALMYGGEPAAVRPESLAESLEEIVEEGLIGEQMAHAIVEQSHASRA